MSSVLQKRIALISTGDELVNGEIVDTNGQYFSQKMFAQGMLVKDHFIVSDDQADIERIIRFALLHHDAIILCGGLGPTSDDRTRHALAAVLGEPLIFDSASWHAIEQRLISFGLSVHQDNRQQAFFPQGADILHNPNGTAPGCRVHTAEKLLFMLPGPPRECRPMFDEVVLPYLKKIGFSSNAVFQLLKLIGVIEADVAHEVDLLAKVHGIKTGYRHDYPYLDVKLLADESKAHALSDIVHTLALRYKNHLVAREPFDAPTLLKQLVATDAIHLTVNDGLTDGWFEKTILSASDGKGGRSLSVSSACSRQLSGLVELRCAIDYQGQVKEYKIQIPERKEELKRYGLHFMCFAVRLACVELFER